jgi:hypothetical protein
MDCVRKGHTVQRILEVLSSNTKNGNNEELHFKNDVRKQDQAKPESQRNIKSVKQMVAVKPEKILILQGNNREWKNERAFFVTNSSGNTT